MFAGRTTAKVLPRDNDLVRREELVVGVERHVPLGQAHLSRWHAGQGVLPKHPILGGYRRVVSEILGRDDLVGVNIVTEDQGLAGNDLLHGTAQSGLTRRSFFYVAGEGASSTSGGWPYRARSLLIVLSTPRRRSSHFSPRRLPGKSISIAPINMVSNP